MFRIDVAETGRSDQSSAGTQPYGKVDRAAPDGFPPLLANPGQCVIQLVRVRNGECRVRNLPRPRQPLQLRGIGSLERPEREPRGPQGGRLAHAGLEGVLLSPLYALPQLCSCFAQVVQLRMAAAYRPCTKITGQATAHLSGPPDAEPFLKS
jgi:hypothetical protein